MWHHHLSHQICTAGFGMGQIKNLNIILMNCNTTPVFYIVDAKVYFIYLLHCCVKNQSKIEIILSHSLHVDLKSKLDEISIYWIANKMLNCQHAPVSAWSNWQLNCYFTCNPDWVTLSIWLRPTDHRCTDHCTASVPQLLVTSNNCY